MNSAIDITSEQRKTLADFLRQYIPGVAVWGYGSRVQWTARPNSDLDLVAFISPDKKSQIEELKEALAESDLPFLVDLHLWDEIPERFHENIRSNYVVIQEEKDGPISLFDLQIDDWNYTTLGEICAKGHGGVQTGPFGSQLHASDYVADGIPSIMPQNIGDNRIIRDGIARITLKDAERLERYRVRAGDIVYSRRGDVERRALVRSEEDGWLCGTGCLRVRFGTHDVDSAFASFYLGDPRVRAWIVRHAQGATMPNLNTAILSALPFAVPPLEEQQAIAQTLGALDDKVELNREVNETLESIARTIFKSWFVDFYPVRAKAEGREPEGMDADTAALFPWEFQDSELGQIPKGWTIESFDSAVEITGGGTPKTSKPEYWGGDIPWFSIVDAPAPSEVFVIDTEKRITNLGLASCSARLLPVGATIISARGTVGKLAVTGVPMAINQSCYALLPNAFGNNGTFFQTSRLVDILRYRAHGAVFSTITRDTFSSIKLVTPPKTIADSFEEAVGPLMDAILNCRKMSKRLSEIRDTLLPRLISGKLRLPEAGKLAETVL